jgi:hypothetical protein
MQDEARADFSYVHVDYDKLPERLHAGARIVRGIGHEKTGPKRPGLNYTEVAKTTAGSAAVTGALTTVAGMVGGNGWWPPAFYIAGGLLLLAGVVWIVGMISDGRHYADRARVDYAATVITPVTLGAESGVVSSQIGRGRWRTERHVAKTEGSAEAQEVSRATRTARAVAASTAWKSGYLDAQRVRLDLSEETRQVARQCQQIYDLRTELGRGDSGAQSTAEGAAKAASAVRAEQKRQLDSALASVRQRVDALASFADHVAALDVELAALRELERADTLSDRIDEVVARGSAANELATGELDQMRDQLAAAKASVKDLVRLLRGDVAVLLPAEPPEAR